jgi:glycosyltransferase involved in cell wall biosynthesis
MRLCLVSKYPPIEGQVSTINYWLADGLARRGHDITVVTNANEVDPTCRLLSDREPGAEERVRVLNTDSFGRSQFHIPWSNPFVTKLAALTLIAVRDHGAELVFSHYLEPYAVAGYLAASFTAIPHVVTHAGSDVGRLLQESHLRPVYEEIIRHADLFVAKSSSVAAGAGAHARLPARDALTPYGPPDMLFNPQATPLDVNELLDQAGALIREDLGWHTNRFNSDRPTFGMYGKLSAVKGTLQLVEALGQLKRDGYACNLLLMTRWRHGEDNLRDAIRQNGLEADTWLLPFLPNWQIPSWIRRCTAVCYLEHGWPLPSHVAVIPREVLACGVCLVVSQEVRGGAWYRDRLVDDENCMVLDEPHNPVALANRLRSVLEQPARAAELGARGHSAASRMPSYTRFLDGWEALFERCLTLKTSDAHA